MKITVEINTDNAAFEDNGFEKELRNVFAKLAYNLAFEAANGTLSDGRVYDSNGNRIGYWEAR